MPMFCSVTTVAFLTPVYKCTLRVKNIVHFTAIIGLTINTLIGYNLRYCPIKR
jgi:hypothetical protein